ncbi:Transcriptional regulator, XRE family [Mycoavidus cysteinexigens]|uniref:Transcriptional regulator, XRE family n=1 Tax=Mycoavidus cysteinexigens TaxID=1553431 RepID=A0A2Z6ETV3_9BURK|nr:hypothetical protein [Mycoavidus cysteinexigens]BBE08840.1 Transcriptional regulator, XRE family [Mycoavidus cysteinexigens]GAM52446.1 hypothetical protein EBME_0909 [bacterium endosymbiont of Mortierella elongata FMR23-6]GLR01139.1 hypothetical protein GCM10007934_09510 [Mycoavidus cysteinexigens]
MAAKTSSVSYQHNLSEEMLERTLATGSPPRLLTRQAPVKYVVMAVEETAQHAQRAPSEIWANVARLATSLAPNREELWI